MSDILKIFIPTHNTKIVDNDTFMPIQVGASMHPDLDLCTLKDNVGDNISDKNGYYCELTAHYWVWKHAKELYPDLKYVGFCHYRRFFDFGDDADLILKDPDKWFNGKKKMACFIREGYGAKSIRWCYYCDHQYQDWDMDEQIMREKYPEWAQQFYKVSNENNIYLYAKNCFVMPWEMFDKYCTEMFGILFEHDERFGITPDNYIQHGDLYKTSPYRWNNDFQRQKRFNGYTAERLGSSWYQFNMEEIVTYPYIGTNKYCPEQTPMNQLQPQSLFNIGQRDPKTIRVIRRNNLNAQTPNSIIGKNMKDIRFNLSRLRNLR